MVVYCPKCVTKIVAYLGNLCGACLKITGRQNVYGKRADPHKEAKAFAVQNHKEVGATPHTRAFMFAEVKVASIKMNDEMDNKVNEDSLPYNIMR